MPLFEQTADEYRRLWDTAEIRPERAAQARRAADKVLTGRSLYEVVSGATGVPWYWIGLAHLRESYCNFGTHLHNGDSLKARTVHVPAGRPAKGTAPFKWEESAVDALTIKGLQSVSDWTIERCLFELERFNGFGYRKPGRGPTPYLWADTNHYRSGKFVSDNVYDSGTVDRQDGCAAVLKIMAEIDPSILGASPEADDAITAPKASEEPGEGLLHPQIHDLMKVDSWSYWANRLGVKSLGTAAIAVFAFLREHAFEIVAAMVAGVIVWELLCYAQRAARIKREA